MSEQDRNVMNQLVVSGVFDPSAPTTSIELWPGQVVSVPTALLVERLPASGLAGLGDGAGMAEQIVIPVVEEQMIVTKRVVPLETVRVVKTSEPFLETAEVELKRERWEVTTLPRDTEVRERSPVRTEGETSIYPVYEERLVARKALFLVEEIHLRKVLETRQETVEEELHRDVVLVERNVS